MPKKKKVISADEQALILYSKASNKRRLDFLSKITIDAMVAVGYVKEGQNWHPFKSQTSKYAWSWNKDKYQEYCTVDLPIHTRPANVVLGHPYSIFSIELIEKDNWSKKELKYWAGGVLGPKSPAMKQLCEYILLKLIVDEFEISSLQYLREPMEYYEMSFSLIDLDSLTSKDKTKALTHQWKIL